MDRKYTTLNCGLPAPTSIAAAFNLWSVKSDLEGSPEKADDMAYLLTENGIAVDNATFVEQLKGLKNLNQVKAGAKEIYDAAKDLQTAIAAIKG